MLQKSIFYPTLYFLYNQLTSTALGNIRPLLIKQSGT